MLANAPRPFNFDLGETADAIRESVHGFAQDRIAPLAERIDREDWFPRELWPQMGELGLHGITVEEEWGGAGLGYLEHAVAMEEISRASASVGLPTARIRTSASTSCVAGARRSRRSATWASSSPASIWARSRCPSPAPAPTSCRCV